jgi:hypothetical protein
LRNVTSGTPKADSMAISDALLREWNHRVKNNFQIIASLINLKKRIMPPGRRADVRFIQEHVQSMAVAYRLVYATGLVIDVSVPELIMDVLSGLRQIANLREDGLRLDLGACGAAIGLDRASARALYLAVVLPPQMDRAAATSGVVIVSVDTVADVLTLSVGGTGAGPIVPDRLRDRLMQAYAGQMQAEILPATEHADRRLRFLLDPPPMATAAPPRTA